MGRIKSNNALNKENKKKSISVSPKKVNGDCVLEKNNSVIRPALKSNSKKIKKVSFKNLNDDNIISVQKAESSIPATNKLYTTGKKRKVSVALEKSDVIDKMVVNNSAESNCTNLPIVNGRKRKGSLNTDLALNPKKKKGIVLIDQTKNLKIVLVDLESPTKVQTIKKDLQKTCSSSIEENGKVGKKNISTISPKSKKAKINKSKSSPPINRKSIEENGVAGKIKATGMSPKLKKLKKEKDGVELKNAKSIEKNYIAVKKGNGILQALKKAKHNKSVSPRSMKTKSIEKNGFAGKIIDVVPELTNSKKDKGVKPNSAKLLKIALVNLETPTKAKMIKEDLQKTCSSSNKENGKIAKINILKISPKSIKAKINKSKSPPPTNRKSIEKNGIAGTEMSPETKKANDNKMMPSKNTKKNGIAAQINDSVNLKISNKECVTIDQFKDSVNLQRAKLNDFRRLKRLVESKIMRFEQKGIKGFKKTQQLKKLENLENSISDEKTKLDSLRKNVRKMMIKDKPLQVCTTGLSQPVEGTQNAPAKKELVLVEESVIGVNDIAVQINDSGNFEINEESFTIDQLKDYVNLKKFRLNEMKKIKCLNARKIHRKEKKGIPLLVYVQDVINLKKLKDSISDEAKKLEYLQKRLDRMIIKANPEHFEVSVLEGILNTYITKKLVYGGETIIDVNARLGLLANISVWSELLANLPEEDRVMIFEPPSLLVPFLAECEPLLPLRQVLKDLELLIQKEQEKKELEQQLLALQIPAAILEDRPSLPPTDDSEAKADAAPVTILKDNGPLIPPTDHSEAKADAAPVTILEDNGPLIPPIDHSEAKADAAPATVVELEEAFDSEKDEEEEKPKKKKGKGFKKANYCDESDSSWESSEEESLVSDDEYDDVKKVVIIKQDLELCDIVNLENKEPITDSASSSCLRSDKYFSKPVGKLLIDIGSGLAHEYFQRDILRDQKRRLHEQEKLQKKCDLLKKSIHILCKNLEISAAANSDFKFKQKICKFCDFQSESLHVMAFHMNSPHDIEDDKFKCNYCDIEKDSSSVILEHMKAVHGIAGHVEAPLPDMPCPLCPFNLKISLSTHLKTCVQRFDINRNLVPESWDFPAKIMHKETIKCPDEFVNNIRSFLSKSSVVKGSADCSGQTTTENLIATPAFAAGESITNPGPNLTTPASYIKSVSQEKKERKKNIDELLKIGKIQLL